MTKRKFLISVAIVLLLCVTACQVYYFGKRRLPAISGQVLDMKTGQPIVGADVGACYLGPMRSLAAPARPIPIGGGGTGKTDAQGRFSFPASWLHVGSPLDFLIGPQEKTGIWMLVYSKDYVTCLSQYPGFDWKQDHRVLAYKTISLERTGSMFKGYQYKIKTTRPETEQDWREKIEMTGMASEGLPDNLADEWVFNDLTRYLERWPEGEKTETYWRRLWETANLVPCNPYEQDDFARGKLSRKRMETYCKRAKRIIALEESFTKPPLDMSLEAFKKVIEKHKKQLSCGEKLLHANGNIVKGK